METKFIEGTNKQYSIREDGVVFIHYKLKRITNTRKDKIIDYRELTLLRNNMFNININGLRKQLSINTLLFLTFGFKICKKCNQSNSTLNANNICEICNKKAKRNNCIRNVRIYRKKYPDKIKILNKKHVDSISTSYIGSKLKIPVSLLSPEIIEAKRQQLKLHRECKKADLNR